MKYRLVIVFLLVCVQSQHQNGLEPSDQLVPLRKIQTQTNILVENNQLEPEIPSHNKPYQEEGQVDQSAKRDNIQQEDKHQETSRKNGNPAPHQTTMLDDQEDTARLHRDSRNTIAQPSQSRSSVVTESSTDSKTQKKIDDNSKTNDRKQPLKANQQSSNTNDELAQKRRQITQKENGNSEISPTPATKQGLQTATEGNSKETGVKNKYSQEQNQQYHQKKQEERKDITANLQPLTKTEQRGTEITKPTLTPEDEETIVIKPANKKKNQEEKGEKDVSSIPGRKELMDTKKEAKIIDPAKEGQEEKVLKNREFEKQNHPLEAQVKSDPKAEVIQKSDAPKPSSKNTQELYHQTQQTEKKKDSQQIKDNQIGKQQQVVYGKTQQKETKEKDRKITIITLRTQEIEEKTDRSKMEDGNISIDQNQLNKGQPAQSSLGQAQEVLAPPQKVLAPPLKKQETGAENKNVRKQKRLEVQPDPKETKEEVPSKVHQQKISKLIEEVKNTKGELAENSKKQIIKYLEAGKGLVKESEPKAVLEQAVKPMLRAQKPQHQEQSSAVQDQQLAVQHPKEPQQMDTTTIIFIIVLTFVISIPIVKEIRRTDGNEAQDSSINDKTSLDVEKVDSCKVQDLIDYNTVPNSSGYDTGERLDQIFN